jgi:hypothetical protein
MKTKLFYFNIYFFAFLFVIATLTVFGCHINNKIEGNNLIKLEDKTFDTFPGKNFSLKTTSGDVVIKTSDEPKVTVKIYGDEQAKKKMDFSFNSNNDGISVIAKKKEAWNIFNLLNSFHLRFEITLPTNYNSNVNTAGGNINITNLNGEVKLKSSGGDISISNINGNISANTSGGNIFTNNTNGTVNISTSGGNIKAIDFVGNLNASTSGGNVDLDGSEGKIDASTSGGEVSLNYSGKNKGINLSSSGGNIAIKLPSNFDADALLSTSGGSINCAFKTNNTIKFSSSKIEGKFNNGGNELVAKTSGGNIEVTQK